MNFWYWAKIVKRFNLAPLQNSTILSHKRADMTMNVECWLRKILLMIIAMNSNVSISFLNVSDKEHIAHASCFQCMSIGTEQSACRLQIQHRHFSYWLRRNMCRLSSLERGRSSVEWKHRKLNSTSARREVWLCDTVNNLVKYDDCTKKEVISNRNQNQRSYKYMTR